MKLKSVILSAICILAYFDNTVAGSLQELHESLPTNEEKEQYQVVNEIEKLFQEGKLSETKASLPIAIPTVTVENDNIPGQVGGSAILPCNFKVCQDTGFLPTITWKVGGSPHEATRVATCHKYDRNTGQCGDFVVHDANYQGRIGIIDVRSPSLYIFMINKNDNRNFWCQVQTDKGTELGTDMKSVALQLQESPNERPKTQRVSLEYDIMVGAKGRSVTLKCSCSGSHCNDVAWYKGPTNELGNEYVNIYSKKMNWKHDPTITVNPDWENRINIEGYTITIDGLTTEDTGRYWCQTKASEYYNYGETGTDAKSLALLVEDNITELLC